MALDSCFFGKQGSVFIIAGPNSKVVLSTEAQQNGESLNYG